MSDCDSVLMSFSVPVPTDNVPLDLQDGADWKELDSPRGLTFHPDGNLYITDFNNHRIVALDPDSGKMTYLCREGTEPGRLLRPQVSPLASPQRMVLGCKDSGSANFSQLFEYWLTFTV